MANWSNWSFPRLFFILLRAHSTQFLICRKNRAKTSHRIRKYLLKEKIDLFLIYFKLLLKKKCLKIVLKMKIKTLITLL